MKARAEKMARFRDLLDKIFPDMNNPAACAEMTELWESLAVRKLCFWACVNMVSGAVSKCEFKTYEGGIEKRTSEYYLWNVQPNVNQGSGAFMRQLIAKLFMNNEVLIFDKGNQLFVADSFGKKESGVNETIFSDISVKNEVIYSKKRQKDVIYIKLASENVREQVDLIFTEYQKLISYGIGAVKRENGNKGIIEIDSMRQGTGEEQAQIDKKMQEAFKAFFIADSSVIRLNRGYKYIPLSKAETGKADTRDIRAMINDVFDFTATAFGIPPKLIAGEIENTGNAIDQFLTFCIDPLTDMICEEINRKRYTESEILHDTKIVIDTKAVRHVDLLSVAMSVDKLISSGAFSINDIREVVGEAPLKDAYADEHWLTKNYSKISDIAEGLSGGDGSE
jgi:HK97 family phage portal protein